MPRPAQAPEAWWAELEDVRERIEQRRASDRRGGMVVRGERVIMPGQHLQASPVPARRREVSAGSRSGRPDHHHRRPSDRVGPHPDRLAGWAVVLGLMLVVVAILSAHG